MFNPILNRLRVFAFGILVAVMGLVSPTKTIQAVTRVLTREDWIAKEIDRLHR